MKNHTHIIKKKKRELIYTGIFLGLAALLVVLLLMMFLPSKTDSSSVPHQNTTSDAHYIPGIYTASFRLGEQYAEAEVTVDASRITGIRLVNLSSTVSAMYPLAAPSMEHLASQICEKQSLEDLTCDSSSQYTSQILLDAIQRALSKAAPSEEVSLYSVTNV